MPRYAMPRYAMVCYAVKAADPTMPVSMGGLSGATQVALDSLRVMKLWFASHRKDKKFAADILNLHFYCNDEQTAKGASPEEHSIA